MLLLHDLLLAHRAHLFLDKPLFDALGVEEVVAWEAVDLLPALEFVVADGATKLNGRVRIGFGPFLVNETFELLELLLGQSLANVADTLLQLQQLLVCHVVRVDVLT